MTTARSALKASAVLFIANAAHASDGFPGAIRDAWGISDLRVPGQGCLLCHMTDPGVLGNVQQPFGLTVKKYEVPIRNPQALQTALGKIRAAGTDSDGDGLGDYAELVGGTNVNVVNEMETEVLEPPEEDPDSGSSGSPSSEEGASSAGLGGRPPLQTPSQPGPVRTPPLPETGCNVSAPPATAVTAWLFGCFALFALCRRSRCL